MTTFGRWIGPLKRRVLLMVSRAVVELVDDARRLQTLQVTGYASEVLDGAERFQQYGFTSVPHPEAEAVVLAVGGERQHPIVIAVEDRRYRLVGLEDGEVALYTDEDEDEDGMRHRVHLARGRGIILEAGDVSVVLDPAAGQVRVKGRTEELVIV